MAVIAVVFFAAAAHGNHFDQGPMQFRGCAKTVLRAPESLPSRRLLRGVEKNVRHPVVLAGAKKVLETNGGTLIRLENLKQRNMRFKLNGNFFAFDPNRIFSRTGIIQTLRTFGPITNKAIDVLSRYSYAQVNL